MANRLTYAALGTALGISKQAVQKCVRLGMPRNSVEAASAWRKANLNPRKEKRTVGTIGEETTRLKAAQADLAELEAAEKRAKIVDFEDALQAMLWIVSLCAQQMESLPGRTASQLAAMTETAAIHQFLFDEIRRIREAMAQCVTDFADAVARSASPDTATEQDAGPVG